MDQERAIFKRSRRMKYAGMNGVVQLPPDFTSPEEIK